MQDIYHCLMVTLRISREGFQIQRLRGEKASSKDISGGRVEGRAPVASPAYVLLGALRGP